MLNITQFYLKIIKPSLFGFITKFLYFSSSIHIGKGFKCDSIPKILIDPAGRLKIDDNVTFKCDVEIRVHNHASLEIKSGVKIDRGVRILGANKSKIIIENGARIGLYSVLNGGDSIFIGKNTLISGFVYIQTSMHNRTAYSIPIQEQGYSHAAIVMESDIWLGAHVVILPGVVIGKGAIVGSNAVVTKNIPSNTIYAGIPAKKINDR